MGNVIFTKGSSSCTALSHLSSSQLTFSTDCSAFLNWRDGQLDSYLERVVVFRSLVATVKLQPTLDDSLEAKAVNFLESVNPEHPELVDAFLSKHGRTTDESLANFVQSIVVLITTPGQSITTAAMKMLDHLITNSSQSIRLGLVKADLIPQLINNLNPLSLSFAKAIDIHTYLMKCMNHSLWLASPYGLEQLGIEDGNEQQDVHEMVLKQVLIPSEKYICHLCANRFSIIDGDQSLNFMILLARLLRISPSYQPATEFFLIDRPVFLTIPSCVTFFEDEKPIRNFLYEMNRAQDDWNEVMGEDQQRWKTMHRMLRMEGIDDAIEKRLRNDKTGSIGGYIVESSTIWNDLQGMNLPAPW
ncbi:hypothetical protein BLNAU_12043 [Blattamonas nauphoetae]|uniref:Uncharacterized protein n=1 Tax=Blattamonas nauphoetae TaxID=2049346 RepID=A0ABQ9XNG0_9EUKA|nr:hypothetical protein BLNAU_12043 [Blattamonas nauphoetae]